MPRFTFKKTERLCSRTTINSLYASGKSFYAGNLKIIFNLQENPSAIFCRVVFSVPKKNFKRAVDRNLIKRRLREAYRLNKNALYNKLAEKNVHVDTMILYTSKKELSFEEINNSVKQAFNILIDKTGGTNV